MALLAALVVPGYAVFDALRAVLDPADPASRAALLDLGRWLTLLGNSAIVCGIALLTAGVLGGLFGLLATRTDLPGRRVLLGAALFGACIPVYVSLVFFFARVPLIDLAESAVACGALYGLAYTPLAILVLGVAFRSADRDLEDLALLDASPRRVLLRVTLPLALWGIVALATLVVLLVATDSAISDLLMVRTFAEEINSQYALDGRRSGPLLTALPVLVGLAALLLTVQARYHFFGQHSPWQFGSAPRVFKLGRWRAPAGVACGLVVMGGFGWPIATFVERAREVPDPWAAAVALQPELLHSTLLAALGATLVIMPAAGLAGSVVRGGWPRWVTIVAVVVLLALPAPVVGISLKGLLNRPGVLGWIHDAPIVVSVGYFVRFLPIGVLLLIPAVRRLPAEAEWAAQVDGCGWTRLQWHIRWPAMATDAALAWLVIVILCFAEVGATVLLHAPGWATASVTAFLLLHKGVYGDLAVLALLSAGFVLLPWLLIVCLLRRALPGIRGAR